MTGAPMNATDWLARLVSFDTTSAKTNLPLIEDVAGHLDDLGASVRLIRDDEDAKAGVAVADLPELALAVSELPGLKLRGLMCIPAVRQEASEQRQPFAEMRKQKSLLEESGIRLDTLSMGMTADYKAAIREGATMVRIGTALFGARE